MYSVDYSYFDKVFQYLKYFNFDSEKFNQNYPKILPDYLCGLDPYILFKYNYGASKITLFFTEYPNYCIKIPFNVDIDEADICEKENNIYHDAQKNQVSTILLPIIKIGSINNHNIYAQYVGQPLAENTDILVSNSDSIKKISKTASKKDSNIIENATDSIEWNYYVLQYYGFKKGYKILNYLYYNLSDLRDENIGFIGEKPIIFDYGGAI